MLLRVGGRCLRLWWSDCRGFERREYFAVLARPMGDCGARLPEEGAASQRPYEKYCNEFAIAVRLRFEMVETGGSTEIKNRNRMVTECQRLFWIK